MNPLFILAPPRSFTSVSCAMIGQHPEMLGLPETNLFARETYGELSQLFIKRARLQHGTLRVIAELALGDQKPASIEIVKQWLGEKSHLTTIEIFADIVAWAETRCPVEKSPLHVYNRLSLDRMNRGFPDARYLHLTRDPRGTCESIYALRKQTAENNAKLKSRLGIEGRKDGVIGSNADLTPETMWFDPHLCILEFLEGIPADQQMRLRGEDLLADPDKYLIEIAEWLGIDTGADALEAMKRPEESPFACMGPPNALLGNDPSFLKDPRLREYHPKPCDLTAPLSWDSNLVFTDVVKDLATMLGY